MINPVAISCMLLASACAPSNAQNAVRQPVGQNESAHDDFENGICIGFGCAWTLAQQVNGKVQVLPAPPPLMGNHRNILQAAASPKKDGVVAKAALIRRIAPAPTGSIIRVEFDLFVPSGVPINSVQLTDLECATCGENGNPGIRLYVRNGRLRIDRSKIGIKNAWVRDDGPRLSHDRWHTITLQMFVSADEDGWASADLDGIDSVSGSGATIMPLSRQWVDRVQLGVTANSNPVPVTYYFDNVSINIRAPKTHNGSAR